MFCQWTVMEPIHEGEFYQQDQVEDGTLQNFSQPVKICCVDTMEIIQPCSYETYSMACCKCLMNFLDKNRNHAQQDQ